MYVANTFQVLTNYELTKRLNRLDIDETINFFEILDPFLSLEKVCFFGSVVYGTDPDPDQMK